tara:strand:- start:34 stop:489 length:456 start_codon:yes stop_codon:yes gene_type:complete
MFDKKNLNHDGFHERAKAEAEEIFSKPSTRKGRSLEKIIETVEYGHTAEWYLIKEMGYTDNPERYHDVIDPDGHWVEIKCTKIQQYIPSVIEKLNDRRRDLEEWGKPAADKAMIFINNSNENTYYEFGGYYEWDGFKFCEKTCLHLTKGMV